MRIDRVIGSRGQPLVRCTGCQAKGRRYLLYCVDSILLQVDLLDVAFEMPPPNDLLEV